MKKADAEQIAGKTGASIEKNADVEKKAGGTCAKDVNEADVVKQAETGAPDEKKAVVDKRAEKTKPRWADTDIVDVEDPPEEPPQ